MTESTTKMSPLGLSAQAIFTPVDTHATLERQLRRLDLDPDTPPDLEAWRRLIASVSQVYAQNDLSRYTTERAMQLSSREMRELHNEIVERERRLRFVLSSSGFGLCEWDFKTKKVSYDDEAVAIMRLPDDWRDWPIEDILGRFPDENDDVVHEGLRLAVASDRPVLLPLRVREGDVIYHLECRLITERDDKGRPVRMIGTIADVTDRVRAESERQQNQKLESIGQLAAGIAHEINTPVQFVSDSLHFVNEATQDLLALVGRHDELLTASVEGRVRPEDVVQAREEFDDADVEYLQEQMPKAIERALEGLDRVATIVRSLKEFAHPDDKDMVYVDLNRGIEASLNIARNEYKYVADLDIELGELPLVRCRAGDTNQVVLNIVVNAAHAIGDVVVGTEDRGRITVRTATDGDCAVITITDTGGGIPREVQNRIFDPFFTTKALGKGTGQGLAISRTVIDKHNGSLTFDTAEGRGTTFTIRLPIEGAPS